MIQVKNLTKRYGRVPAVNDISFSIDKPGVYGFLGPNGAGKSTTMNILTGCLAPTSGEVRICGYDIYEEEIMAKAQIGYLPENPPVYMDMTPYEYLKFVANAKGIRGHRAEKEVQRVMGVTGLERMSSRLIMNLSKGYRQRVGIAQALLGDPKVIILDEPTVGLDPIQIIEIMDLIRTLGQRHVVFLSTHILPEVSAVCDYIIVIAHGRVVAADTLDNLNRSFAENEIIRITTKGDGNRLKRAVEEIPGADEVSVKNSGSALNLEIKVLRGTDIREQLSGALRELDMPILSFTSTAQSLEDIFIKLVYAQNMVEEDPALPAAKKKADFSARDNANGAGETKGRAYYSDDSADAAEESDGYTSIFAAPSDDENDGEGKEN